jgi:non-heme chloroperoxidase
LKKKLTAHVRLQVKLRLTDMNPKKLSNPAPIPVQSRRAILLGGAGLMAAACAPKMNPQSQPASTPEAPCPSEEGRRIMSHIVTQDGTEIYYKDWGEGRPVVFSHGWPLSSDSWESQMLFLAERGFRCIAHDRRGHGRSSQPWKGNDMNTYADDLAQLIETLGIEDATLIGFSTGGGEVARYIGRHGTKHLKQAALISAVPPLMVKTPENPEGTPREVFDGLRAGSLADRSKLYKDLASGPFFGFNRPGAKVSQGMIDSFWLQGMQSGHKNAYDCIKAFSETDLTEDLRKFDVPTLIIHGDDDQIVPIVAAAAKSSKLVKNATYKVYKGAPHGITDTHKDQLNEDLLAFVKG